ncbi:hypothetical protein TWF696_003568 [Orbilia brochopaga]|uniref:Methyltransferase domain-containing protein n=1 Tax=Orbilia brochopaga TaxID=3140254 RepID=A0AAV9TXN7_9PEZI
MAATREEQRLPTMAAYDRWAATYDSDGNIMQMLDDIFIGKHLPPLIQDASSPHPQTVVVDLGCGTGRNTLKLARLGATVVAVDNSVGMVRRLREKLAQDEDATLAQRVTVVMQDLSAFPAGDLLPALSTLPPHSETSDVATTGQNDVNADATASTDIKKVDGVVSTLVLEHLSLKTFFAVAAAILKPQGWLLLTNMHADIGACTSAGFVDPVTGNKVRPVSINHTEEDILSVARTHGFALDGAVSEDGVRDEAHAAKLGPRALKWVGYKMHLGMLLRLDG